MGTIKGHEEWRAILAALQQEENDLRQLNDETPYARSKTDFRPLFGVDSADGYLQLDVAGLTETELRLSVALDREWRSLAQLTNGADFFAMPVPMAAECLYLLYSRSFVAAQGFRRLASLLATQEARAAAREQARNSLRGGDAPVPSNGQYSAYDMMLLHAMRRFVKNEWTPFAYSRLEPEQRRALPLASADAVRATLKRHVTENVLAVAEVALAVEYTARTASLCLRQRFGGYFAEHSSVGQYPSGLGAPLDYAVFFAQEVKQAYARRNVPRTAEPPAPNQLWYAVPDALRLPTVDPPRARNVKIAPVPRPFKCPPPTMSDKEAEEVNAALNAWTEETLKHCEEAPLGYAPSDPLSQRFAPLYLDTDAAIALDVHGLSWAEFAVASDMVAANLALVRHYAEARSDAERTKLLAVLHRTLETVERAALPLHEVARLLLASSSAMSALCAELDLDASGRQLYYFLTTVMLVGVGRGRIAALLFTPERRAAATERLLQARLENPDAYQGSGALGVCPETGFTAYDVLVCRAATAYVAQVWVPHVYHGLRSSERQWCVTLATAAPADFRVAAAHAEIVVKRRAEEYTHYLRMLALFRAVHAEAAARLYALPPYYFLDSQVAPALEMPGAGFAFSVHLRAAVEAFRARSEESPEYVPRTDELWPGFTAAVPALSLPAVMVGPVPDVASFFSQPVGGDSGARDPLLEPGVLLRTDRGKGEATADAWAPVGDALLNEGQRYGLGTHVIGQLGYAPLFLITALDNRLLDKNGMDEVEYTLWIYYRLVLQQAGPVGLARSHAADCVANRLLARSLGRLNARLGTPEARMRASLAARIRLGHTGPDARPLFWEPLDAVDRLSRAEVHVLAAWYLEVGYRWLPGVYAELDVDTRARLLELAVPDNVAAVAATEALLRERIDENRFREFSFLETFRALIAEESQAARVGLHNAGAADVTVVVELPTSDAAKLLVSSRERGRRVAGVVAATLAARMQVLRRQQSPTELTPTARELWPGLHPDQPPFVTHRLPLPEPALHFDSPDALFVTAADAELPTSLLLDVEASLVAPARRPDGATFLLLDEAVLFNGVTVAEKVLGDRCRLDLIAYLVAAPLQPETAIRVRELAARADLPPHKADEWVQFRALEQALGVAANAAAWTEYLFECQYSLYLLYFALRARADRLRRHMSTPEERRALRLALDLAGNDVDPRILEIDAEFGFTEWDERVAIAETAHVARHVLPRLYAALSPEHRERVVEVFVRASLLCPSGCWREPVPEYAKLVEAVDAVLGLDAYASFALPYSYSAGVVAAVERAGQRRLQPRAAAAFRAGPFKSVYSPLPVRPAAALFELMRPQLGAMVQFVRGAQPRPPARLWSAAGDEEEERRPAGFLPVFPAPDDRAGVFFDARMVQSVCDVYTTCSRDTELRLHSAVLPAGVELPARLWGPENEPLAERPEEVGSVRGSGRPGARPEPSPAPPPRWQRRPSGDREREWPDAPVELGLLLVGPLLADEGARERLRLVTDVHRELAPALATEVFAPRLFALEGRFYDVAGSTPSRRFVECAAIAQLNLLLLEHTEADLRDADPARHASLATAATANDPESFLTLPALLQTQGAIADVGPLFLAKADTRGLARYVYLTEVLHCCRLESNAVLEWLLDTPQKRKRAAHLAREPGPAAPGELCPADGLLDCERDLLRRYADAAELHWPVHAYDALVPTDQASVVIAAMFAMGGIMKPEAAVDYVNSLLLDYEPMVHHLQLCVDVCDAVEQEGRRRLQIVPRSLLAPAPAKTTARQFTPARNAGQILLRRVLDVLNAADQDTLAQVMKRAAQDTATPAEVRLAPDPGREAAPGPSRGAPGPSAGSPSGDTRTAAATIKLWGTPKADPSAGTAMGTGARPKVPVAQTSRPPTEPRQPTAPPAGRDPFGVKFRFTAEPAASAPARAAASTGPVQVVVKDAQEVPRGHVSGLSSGVKKLIQETTQKVGSFPDQARVQQERKRELVQSVDAMRKKALAPMPRPVLLRMPDEPPAPPPQQHRLEEPVSIVRAPKLRPPEASAPAPKPRPPEASAPAPKPRPPEASAPAPKPRPPEASAPATKPRPPEAPAPTVTAAPPPRGETRRPIVRVELPEIGSSYISRSRTPDIWDLGRAERAARTARGGQMQVYVPPPPPTSVKEIPKIARIELLVPQSVKLPDPPLVFEYKQPVAKLDLGAASTVSGAQSPAPETVELPLSPPTPTGAEQEVQSTSEQSFAWPSFSFEQPTSEQPTSEQPTSEQTFAWHPPSSEPAVRLPESTLENISWTGGELQRPPERQRGRGKKKKPPPKQRVSFAASETVPPPTESPRTSFAPAVRPPSEAETLRDLKERQQRQQPQAGVFAEEDMAVILPRQSRSRRRRYLRTLRQTELQEQEQEQPQTEQESVVLPRFETRSRADEGELLWPDLAEATQRVAKAMRTRQHTRKKRPRISTGQAEMVTKQASPIRAVTPTRATEEEEAVKEQSPSAVTMTEEAARAPSPVSRLELVSPAHLEERMESTAQSERPRAGGSRVRSPSPSTIVRPRSRLRVREGEPEEKPSSPTPQLRLRRRTQSRSSSRTREGEPRDWPPSPPEALSRRRKSRSRSPVRTRSESGTRRPTIADSMRIPVDTRATSKGIPEEVIREHVKQKFAQEMPLPAEEEHVAAEMEPWNPADLAMRAAIAAGKDQHKLAVLSEEDARELAKRRKALADKKPRFPERRNMRKEWAKKLDECSRRCDGDDCIRKAFRARPDIDTLDDLRSANKEDYLRSRRRILGEVRREARDRIKEKQEYRSKRAAWSIEDEPPCTYGLADVANYDNYREKILARKLRKQETCDYVPNPEDIEEGEFNFEQDVTPELATTQNLFVEKRFVDRPVQQSPQSVAAAPSQEDRVLSVFRDLSVPGNSNNVSKDAVNSIMNKLELVFDLSRVGIVLRASKHLMLVDRLRYGYSPVSILYDVLPVLPKALNVCKSVVGNRRMRTYSAVGNCVVDMRVSVMDDITRTGGMNYVFDSDPLPLTRALIRTPDYQKADKTIESFLSFTVEGFQVPTSNPTSNEAHENTVEAANAQPLVGCKVLAPRMDTGVAF